MRRLAALASGFAPLWFECLLLNYQALTEMHDSNRR